MSQMPLWPPEENRRLWRASLWADPLSQGAPLDKPLAPFDKEAFHPANNKIWQEITVALSDRPANLRDLQGDPRLQLSWVVVGTKACRPDLRWIRMHKDDCDWALCPRAREALAQRQLPDPVGLVNGINLLMRQRVHPRYGQEGWA